MQHISYAYAVVRIFCSLVLHKGKFNTMSKSLKIQLMQRKLMLNTNKVYDI